MNSKEIVVRIIQPADKAQPPRRPVALQAKPADNLFHNIFNAVALTAIAALGFYLIVIFCQQGISLNDIFVMVGLPLSLGLVTSYALL